MSFKRLFLENSYFSSGGHYVQLCAILVESIMRNISVKLFEFGPAAQEKLFLFLALAALYFDRG